MTKPELRRQMRKRLTALGPARPGKSQDIVAALVRQPAMTGHPRIALFSPMLSEPDIETLWKIAPGHFCYPRVAGSEIEFVEVEKLDDLTATTWHPHIREPHHAGARIVPPAEIDVILVPGLAYTRQGQRLGRGGGYYDRYLAVLPSKTLKIGVCFALQLLKTLPVELHDQRVNAVVTEEGFLH